MLLFESFNNIASICKKYGIKNYTINPDGTVDVNGHVYLISEGLTKSPLKFGKVTGNFVCTYNKLITLEGGPREVGGDFNCSYNQLTSLEGSPREVTGDFNCHNNKLTTLEGGPISVGVYFNCNDNPIYSVYKLFPDRKSYMDSLDYNYLRGTDIVKSRFKEACEEANIKIPNKINGYNYI